jgi:beta-alanine degradation protein BauB
VAEHHEVSGPVASKLLLENDHIKIWEADVGPGEDFPLHHHAYDYVLFTTGDPALLELRDYGRPPSTVPVPAHAAIFIPAGGTESYSNVGKTRFTEVLIEVKRPRRPDQERVDFATSNALAGRDPLPGVVHLLENSRVRIVETWLTPGESTGMARQSDDAAIFVLSGTKVKVVEQDDRGRRSFEDSRADNAALWQPGGGVSREVVNIGNRPYRELSVQVK